MGIFDNATSVVINNKEVQSIVGPNNTIYYQKIGNIGEHWYFDDYGVLLFENLIFDKVYLATLTNGSSNPEDYTVAEWFAGLTSGYSMNLFESGDELVIYRTIESYNTQDSEEMESIRASLEDDYWSFASFEDFLDMYPFEEVCRLEYE